MYLKQNANRNFYLTASLLLMLTVVLGRLTSYFNTIFATDIAVADWVTTLLTYLSEIITSCRTVVSFSTVAVAFYIFKRKTVVLSTILVFGAAILDYAGRFFIDLSTGAIVGVEVLALVWLLLQLAYEAIFITLAVLIIYLVRKQFETSDHPRSSVKYSCIRSVRYALLLVLLSNIASETVYLIDFLNSYTNITNTEIASIIGSFLKIIVIYGGFPYLLAEAMQLLYAKLIFAHKK